MASHWVLIWILFVLCGLLSIIHASYLDAPRINYSGRLRVDANTVNNMRCNFNANTGFVDTESNPNSNTNGTNECSFLDTRIMGVVYPNGTLSAESANVNNDLVGGEISTNDDQPFAKMIDLDVDVQGKSVIYGMKISVRLNNGTVAFTGDVQPSVVSQEYWFRVKCYGPSNAGEHPFDVSFALGAQASTRITNITWNSNLTVPFIEALRSESKKHAHNGSESLSMRLSFYFYTRTYQPFVRKNFTLAHVIGSIGVAREGESLNLGGDRILSPPRRQHLPLPVKMEIKEEDSCYGQPLDKYSPWVYKAPFTVNYHTRLLSIDLSNTLPLNKFGSLRNIGPIQLGMIDTSQPRTEYCIESLGSEPIPYMEDNWFQSNSGILTISLTDQQISDIRNSKLILYQEIDDAETSDDSGAIPFCGDTVFHSMREITHLAYVLIEEVEYYIRPLDLYVDRMEYGDTHSMTLLVTKLGLPAANIDITLKRSSQDTLPEDGLVPEEWEVRTNDNGHAVFIFNAVRPIPYPRVYSKPPCPDANDTSLPIDGQIYLFKYCMTSECPSNVKYLFVPELSFLVFSTVNYTEPYTWLDHVRPIFTQYYALNKAMTVIMNLSDYCSVVENARLIKQAMSLSFDDPNFMPVTRDLSPTKTQVILKWLDNPLYSVNNGVPLTPSCEQGIIESICTPVADHTHHFSPPPRCQLDSIPLYSHPANTDPYFMQFVNKSINSAYHTLIDSAHHPLEGSDSDQTICTLENIRSQLQLSIDVKLYTISLYLTSLYSVKEGCNGRLTRLLYKLSQKEMDHLYHVGLLLYQLGGNPGLTNASLYFPRLGLPAGLLQNLPIDLQSASRRQLYEVFMVLNMPWYANGNATGIDKLFTQIIDCLDYTNVRRALDNTLSKSRQMTIMMGGLENINSIADMIAVLSNILDSSALDDSIFHQIEEIVCQHELVVTNTSYAYSGEQIQFNEQGVWPMMDNPSWEAIDRNTNCYTNVRMFNIAYKKLLRVIEESYSSDSGYGRFEIIKLMKSLKIHFKKVLWTETCGPVFT